MENHEATAVPNANVAACPSRAIVSRLAEKWTMLVLSALETRTMRFGDLRREIEGASQKMLTQTLRRLEEDGLVVRTARDVVPPHVEYGLTPLGRDLAPLVAAIKRWAEANMTKVLSARANARRSPSRLDRS